MAEAAAEKEYSCPHCAGDSSNASAAAAAAAAAAAFMAPGSLDRLPILKGSLKALEKSRKAAVGRLCPKRESSSSDCGAALAGRAKRGEGGFVDVLLAARRAAEREAAAASPPERSDITARDRGIPAPPKGATAPPPTRSQPREVISLDGSEPDEIESAVGGALGGAVGVAAVGNAVGGAPLSKEGLKLARGDTSAARDPVAKPSPPVAEGPTVLRPVPLPYVATATVTPPPQPFPFPPPPRSQPPPPTQRILSEAEYVARRAEAQQAAQAAQAVRHLITGHDYRAAAVLPPTGSPYGYHSALSAWAHANLFQGQRAQGQALVNGVAQPPAPGASSLPSLSPGGAPQGHPPPFAGRCAHFAATYPPPPAACACQAAGGSTPQMAAARLAGGAPRPAPPPPTAAQIATHAAHAAHAAYAALGGGAGAGAPGSAESPTSTGGQESFHAKLQRVRRQLLMEPSLPVS